MAKLALIFIAVFCIFTIAQGARIVRDTNADDLAKQVENAWQSFTKQMEEVLSKDNLDKLAGELKDIGAKIQAAGTDLVTKIEEKTKPQS